MRNALAALKAASAKAAATAAQAIVATVGSAAQDPSVKAIANKLKGNAPSAAKKGNASNATAAPVESPPDAPVMPPPPAPKAATVSIALPFEAVLANAAEFKTAFKKDIARRLGVDKDKVTVKKLSPGSVNVEFTVDLPKAKNTEQNAKNVAAAVERADKVAKGEMTSAEAKALNEQDAKSQVDEGALLASALSESSVPLQLPSIRVALGVKTPIQVNAVLVTKADGEAVDLSKKVATDPIKPVVPKAPKVANATKVVKPVVQNVTKPKTAPVAVKNATKPSDEEEEAAIAKEETEAEAKAAAEQGKNTTVAVEPVVPVNPPVNQSPCQKKQSAQAKAAANKKLFDSKMEKLVKESDGLEKATAFVETVEC